MIYQLPKDHFNRIQPLLHGFDYQLIVTAVIEHTSPGRILVDDPDHPTSCFLSTPEGSFLAGNPNNTSFNRELGKYLQERIIATKTSPADNKELILSVFPKTWTKHFTTLFPTQTPKLIPRHHYTCTQLKWNQPVPNDFAITRIDHTLLANSSVSIPNHVTSWMTSNWRSQDAFLQHGFGFATVHQKQLVSWSLTDCVSENRCEIGIQTHPDYRRQGLATHTAAAAVDYGLHHGFQEIGWHTSVDNIGSIKVAEKIGFEKVTDYIWYLFRF